MNILSQELDEAIRAIFDNPQIGYTALGVNSKLNVDSLGLTSQNNVPLSINSNERIALLRRKLENWVELKGLEIKEFEGDSELIRIRYEALTTLMFLRDLAQYFPDVATASKEEFNKLSKKL